MRAIILTSIFAILVSVSNLNAKNPKVYSNVNASETGTSKEFVVLNDGDKIDKKVTFEYNAEGKIESRIVCEWKGSSGWVNIHKYNYVYNKDGKLGYFVYTKWNMSKNKWSDESDIATMVYNSEGQNLAVEYSNRYRRLDRPIK